MDFEFSLLMRFQSPFVPLEDICEEFFGVSPRRAKTLAAYGGLPVPVTRPTDSQKSPYLVRVSDLAGHMVGSNSRIGG